MPSASTAACEASRDSSASTSAALAGPEAAAISAVVPVSLTHSLALPPDSSSPSASSTFPVRHASTKRYSEDAEEVAEDFVVTVVVVVVVVVVTIVTRYTSRSAAVEWPAALATS